jgi:Rieske Fe-S protein
VIPDDACEGCSLARRHFLRGLGLASLAALTGLGIPAEVAMAITPIPTRARRLIAGNPSYPVPAADADGVQIDRDQEVILVRWEGAVYAFNLSCPHQRTALRWNQGDSQFQCPKHHSTYRPDGTFVSGRATRGMDRFTVTMSGSEIVVDLGAMHKQDQDPTGWSAAMIHV